METKQEFKKLDQVSKFEKQNKGKLKLSDLDYDEKTKVWIATFVSL